MIDQEQFIAQIKVATEMMAFDYKQKYEAQCNFKTQNIELLVRMAMFKGVELANEAWLKETREALAAHAPRTEEFSNPS